MNKNKYLKYKSKYINLKNQIGAGKYSGHVWAYDFDGVVHKLMKSGETYITPHRNPNHEQLSPFENDYSTLIKHIFIETINDMNIGQQNGAKIIIISANSKKYKNSIYKLLNHFGIKINLEDIHMRIFPKNDKIRQLKVTRFLDDSIANIKNLHQDKHNMPNLQQLIWVIPEFSAFFNIFLDKPFSSDNINPFSLEQVVQGSFTNTMSTDWGPFISATTNQQVNKLNWGPFVSAEKPSSTKLPPQDSKTDIIKLLSYNIDFNANQQSKNNIEKFIMSKDLDLIGIQENFWNINYNKTVYDYISDTPKNLNYRTGLFIKKSKFKIIQQIPGNYTRGIVCCRLNHVDSLKNFIVINFHLEHFYNSSLSGSNTTAKTIKLLTTLLEKINFNSDETILLMGDSNEFYEMYVKKYKFPINLKLKNGITTDIYLNTSNPTCCSHNGGPFDYRSDIIGSNINRFEKINGDTSASNNHSDHLPLLGNFKYMYLKPIKLPEILKISSENIYDHLKDIPKIADFNLSNNEYAIYAVPFDYKGSQKQYFIDWGGGSKNKFGKVFPVAPHILLTPFQNIDWKAVDKFLKIISLPFRGAHHTSKRWIFGKSRKIEIKNKLLVNLNFKSSTLTEIIFYLNRNLNLKIIDDFHIILGTSKFMKDSQLNKIIDGIITSVDWKLVLVKKIPQASKSGFRIEWQKSYDLYD